MEPLTPNIVGVSNQYPAGPDALDEVSVTPAEAVIALQGARIALSAAMEAKRYAENAESAARERYNRLTNLVAHLTACVRSGDLA